MEKLAGLKTKPFNHTPASSFFRLACRAEFINEDDLIEHSKATLKAFSTFRAFAKSAKEKAKKKTGHVKGRRPSLERSVKQTPLKKMPARIYYAIAIDIERTLERHYQIKSGESYVLLHKAATNLYETTEKHLYGSSAMKKIVKDRKNA